MEKLIVIVREAISTNRCIFRKAIRAKREIYVPKRAEKKVKEAVERYQTIKNKLNELSEINIQLLIKDQLGGKKE